MIYEYGLYHVIHMRYTLSLCTHSKRVINICGIIDFNSSADNEYSNEGNETPSEQSELTSNAVAILEAFKLKGMTVHKHITVI